MNKRYEALLLPPPSPTTTAWHHEISSSWSILLTIFYPLSVRPKEPCTGYLCLWLKKMAKLPERCPTEASIPRLTQGRNYLVFSYLLHYVLDRVEERGRCLTWLELEDTAPSAHTLWFTWQLGWMESNCSCWSLVWTGLLCFCVFSRFSSLSVSCIWHYSCFSFRFKFQKIGLFLISHLSCKWWHF